MGFAQSISCPTVLWLCWVVVGVVTKIKLMTSSENGGESAVTYSKLNNFVPKRKTLVLTWPTFAQFYYSI